MVLPPFSLWMLRSSWLEKLDSPNVQAEWNEFRDDMKKQSDQSGPVQHKIPKSPEPPLRVWLRDYFWLGGLVLVGVGAMVPTSSLLLLLLWWLGLQYSSVLLVYTGR